MDWLQIVVLGVVQGVTEFLPISSSGHLVVVQALFQETGRKPLPDVLEVNILLHAGTLGAILAYYWREVWRLLSEDRRVIGRLVVGTVPAVIVGLPLEKLFPQVLENTLLTGFGLVATGVMLLWCGRIKEGETRYQQLSYRQVFCIGISQAVAILPGLSRSGWTIAGGMAMGLRRESAAAFSFLLAIPVIAGSTLLKLFDLLDGQSATPVSGLAVGATVAFVVGLASLWALVAIVRYGKMQWFAAWCIPIGVMVILWQLVAQLKT